MEIYNVKKLSMEELCGQLLCLEMTGYKTVEEMKEAIKKNRPGGIYVNRFKEETIKELTDYANKICKYPVIVVADVEFGPGNPFPEEPMIPAPMAWGACDDASLIEKAGELTGKIIRRKGVHLALAPVSDININFHNPLVNVRAVSDSADEVLKITSAYMRGMQKEGRLLATVKHFPGDGVDDRNQHFCTTINRLSKKEWMNTFGKVYKGMIKDGASAFMVAHIALPSYDEENIDPVLGPMPATLSRNLMTNLLKKKLGFKGCLISDAMSMIGSVSLVPINELAPRFVAAGGDFVLFPEKNDLQNLMQAYKQGKLSKARIVDAVNRILELKKKARLFEDQQPIYDSINMEDTRSKLVKVAEEISNKSIKIVRNMNGVLPLKLKKGDKALVLNIYLNHRESYPVKNTQLLTFIEELKKRGIKVDDYRLDINHYKLHKIVKKYDAVFINTKIDCHTCRGADMNVGWTEGIMLFWRGYALENPNTVFTAFGDPYELYQFPFMRTFVNAFSPVETSQKAAVEVLLGERKAEGKNPVALEGFFDRDTE